MDQLRMSNGNTCDRMEDDSAFLTFLSHQLPVTKANLDEVGGITNPDFSEAHRLKSGMRDYVTTVQMEGCTQAPQPHRFDIEPISIISNLSIDNLPIKFRYYLLVNFIPIASLIK